MILTTKPQIMKMNPRIRIYPLLDHGLYHLIDEVVDDSQAKNLWFKLHWRQIADPLQVRWKLIARVRNLLFFHTIEETDCEREVIEIILLLVSRRKVIWNKQVEVGEFVKAEIVRIGKQLWDGVGFYFGAF